MSKRGKRPARKQGKPPTTDHPWEVWAVSVLFFLVQVIFLRGHASTFRQPKEALAIGALGIILAAWAIRRLGGKGLRLPSGPLPLVLAVYPLLLAASALWAGQPLWALQAAVGATVWVAATIFLAGLEQRSADLILRWTLAGTLVSATVLVLQATGLRALPLATFSTTTRGRLTGLAGNPSDLAMAAVLLLPFLLAGRISGLSPAKRWLAAAFLATAVIASQSLTGVVALGGLCLVWALVRGSRRTRLLTALVFLPLGALVAAAGIGWRAPMVLRDVREGNWYSLFSARGDGWTAASQIVADHSLLGVGGANFTYAYYPARLQWLETRSQTGSRGERATHFQWTHCDPLQVVTELGAPGLMWLIALVAGLAAARPRGDPLPWLAATGATPFLLLHYPTHLAVGLVPMALLLSQIMRPGTTRTVTVRRSAARLLVVLVLAGVALSIAWWQIQRLRLDRWRGTVEATLELAHHAPAEHRTAVLATIEDDALARAADLRSAEAWLLRVAGRAALGHGAEIRAERAFRHSLRIWPHEEAEFGLGLALADQGRRGEAKIHLERVCRVNPALLRLVSDPDLRDSLRRALGPGWWNRYRNKAKDRQAGTGKPVAESGAAAGPKREAPEAAPDP